MKPSEMSKNNKLISVIVPVYNVELYLGRCIDSIVNQSYKNLEIILIDDGSTDDSGSICDTYEEKDYRVKVVHKSNGGLSDARNTGVGIATGQYLCFVDSDDYIDHEMFEKMLSHMTDEVDFVSCGTVDEYENRYRRNTRENISDVWVEIAGDSLKEEFILDRNIKISACAKLYRREVIGDHRFPVGRSSEDVPVLWELIKKCKKVISIRTKFYHYFHRRGSITTGEFFAGRLDGNRFAHEILKDVELNYPFLTEEARILYAKFLHANMYQILCSKNRDMFRDTFLQLQNELVKLQDSIEGTSFINDDFVEAMLYSIKASFEEQKEKTDTDRQNRKLLVFYELLLQWVNNRITGYSLYELLKKDGIKTIAIYGMKELGELLYKEIENGDIKVKYIIDMRKEEIVSDVPIYSPEDKLPPVDAIIVTAITFFDEIRETLIDRIPESKIYNLEEMIFEANK